MTVEQLLASISSKELTEWQKFYKLEPFGFDANYLGFAMLGALDANIHRSKKSKTYEVEDFMPNRNNQEQGIDAAIAFARMMTASVTQQEADNGS